MSDRPSPNAQYGPSDERRPVDGSEAMCGVCGHANSEHDRHEWCRWCGRDCWGVAEAMAVTHLLSNNTDRWLDPSQMTAGDPLATDSRGGES